jgi:hypothetical protein
MPLFIKNLLKVFLVCAALLLPRTAGAKDQFEIKGLKGKDFKPIQMRVQSHQKRPLDSNLASDDAPPTIRFEYDGGASADLSGIAGIFGEFGESGRSGAEVHYAPLDGEKYGALGGGFLIQEITARLTTGDRYRVMLICGEVFPSGRVRDIQLAVVDERRTPAAVIQRVKLGGGELPAIAAVPGGVDANPSAVMFTVIREQSYTEAAVYSINSVTGRLGEIMSIDRSYPERARLDVSGVLEPGGIVRVEYAAPKSLKSPKSPESVDLSEALDALIEDGIYQPDGNPIAALKNLRLVRNGWENEAIYAYGDRVRVEVGMSLVTLSKRQVVDVTAVLEIDDKDSPELVDLLFEPFLPYRVE